MQKIDKDFWDNKYKTGDTGWDLGEVSPPLKDYFDQLDDKNIKILIPGGGNAYEAEYLHKKGFKQVYLLDISEVAIHSFKERVPGFPEGHIIHGDFFQHQGTYNLLVEQTFFCALEPTLRKNYVEKVYDLLEDGGKAVGLLFNIPLNDNKPPFGGSRKEYVELFSKKFQILKLETAYNSIAPRAGNELFMIMQKENKFSPSS